MKTFVVSLHSWHRVRLLLMLYCINHREQKFYLFRALQATSHFQKPNARMAFPCLDEPNIKAEYTITLAYYGNGRWKFSKNKFLKPQKEKRNAPDPGNVSILGYLCKDGLSVLG